MIDKLKKLGAIWSCNCNSLNYKIGNYEHTRKTPING